MGVILRHFLRLTSPEMPPVSKIQAHGKAPEEERELGTFAPVANEVEFIRKSGSPPIFSVPAGRIAQAGLFNR